MLRITPTPPFVVSSSPPSSALEQQLPKMIRCSVREQKVAAATSIDDIHDQDVVFGRGGFSYSHKGNRLFRRLVSHNHELYHSTNNSYHRQAVATSIVRAIHRTGGRFVKKDSGGKNGDKGGGRDSSSSFWVSVSDKDACLKTCQALRDANIRAKRPSSSSKTGTAATSATPCSSCNSSVVGPPSCQDQKQQELDLHEVQTEEKKEDESCFITTTEPTRLVAAVSASSLTPSSAPSFFYRDTSFDFHGNESFQAVPSDGHLAGDDGANSNVDVDDIDAETAKVLIQSLAPPRQNTTDKDPLMQKSIGSSRSSPYRSSLIGIEQFQQQHQHCLDYEDTRQSFSSNPSSSMMSRVIKEIEDEFLHAATVEGGSYHPTDQTHFNTNNDSQGIFKRCWSSVTSIALVDALLLSEFENDL
eukprot:CAMPEP_0113445390 /NCGR_PEP_ID=MMETSP0014_2-20120614/3161_1 /TAXON_ID=2857 /ORGANISM="Nitzschia sp." /LENGTH=414 /DNA_ID=CAMNT_0000336439 /DNA_START=187 /DNA_END=1431 /DNA_ORIENTATION=- /assembly_acc=CAM_ASM_000159